jgi:hypothetical protein
MVREGLEGGDWRGVKQGLRESGITWKEEKAPRKPALTKQQPRAGVMRRRAIPTQSQSQTSNRIDPKPVCRYASVSTVLLFLQQIQQAEFTRSRGETDGNRSVRACGEAGQGIPYRGAEVRVAGWRDLPPSLTPHQWREWRRRRRRRRGGDG